MMRPSRSANFGQMSVVVMGSPGVGKNEYKNVSICIIISQSIAGKTSLLITASTNSFPNDCIPTLYDSLDVHVQVTLLSEELLHNQLAKSLISTCRYQTDKGHLLLDVCRDLFF